MSLDHIVKTKPLGVRGVVAQGFPFLLCGILRAIEMFKNEKYVVTGKENIQDSSESTLWLPKHESWADFHNLGSLWWEIGIPPINGMSRTNYFNNKVGSWAADQLMKHTVFVPIIRKQDWQGTEEERLEQNRGALEKLKGYYQRGIDVCIAAEGTSKSNGRIQMPKAGAYHASKVNESSVRCVPIGNSIDTISGNKPRVFLNVGKPFYNEGNRGEFDDKLVSAWARLNTFTLTQLSSHYLVRMAKSGEGNVNLKDMRGIVTQQAFYLSSDGFFVDEGMLAPFADQELWETFLLNATKLGYISDNGTIDTGKILHKPSIKDWKEKDQGNVVQYNANRVESVANVERKVASILAIKF